MAKGLVTGARTTFDDTTDHIIQIESGIEFLNVQDNGIKFIKKLIANRNGKVAKATKYNWDETELPSRRETVSFADGTGTSVDVASSKAWPVGTIARVENELVRVTAHADSNTLTVVRGYAGTTGAAHASKTMLNLGVAGAENSTGPESVTTTAERLYNYVQMFEQAVELSDQEIAELSSEMGNPMNRQLERITLWFWKLFAQSAIYGIKYEDSTNKLHTMGGVRSFLSTNVDNVGGAQTKAALNSLALDLVEAGGSPDTLIMSPRQAVKLADIDASLINMNYGQTSRGDKGITTWFSPALASNLDVIVDHTILTDEAYMLDSSKISLIPLSNNGVDGRLSVVDGTANGQAGQRKILRAYYTLQTDLEAGHGYQYGLTV